MLCEWNRVWAIASSRQKHGMTFRIVTPWVARCLLRDRDRSFCILWYTGILGVVEFLSMDSAYRGHTVGMELVRLLATLAILAGLVWYLRTTRRGVLHVPTLWNEATVTWLHLGIGRHIWVS